MAGCRQNLAGIEIAGARVPSKSYHLYQSRKKVKDNFMYPSVLSLVRVSCRKSLGHLLEPAVVATAWVRVVGAHGFLSALQADCIWPRRRKKPCRFHREAIVRFRWSTVCTEIKEPSCNNSLNPDQLIQRKRGGKVYQSCVNQEVAVWIKLHSTTHGGLQRKTASQRERHPREEFASFERSKSSII